MTSAAPRLFCYALVMSHEQALLQMQRRLGAGIFGCDDWLIFSNSSAVLQVAESPNRTALLPNNMDAAVGGAFRSALNAPLFLVAWRQLQLQLASNSWHIDWVVKSDVDTCFIAARMRQLIADRATRISPQRHAAVWTYRQDLWIPGPLEVLSVAAMHILLRHLDGCAARAAPVDHGEDIWLNRCLGTYHKPRENLHRPPLVRVLNDQRLLCWGGANLRLGRCHEFNTSQPWARSADLTRTRAAVAHPIPALRHPLAESHLALYCHAPQLVAFHPAKSVDQWLACLAAMAYHA